MGQSRHPWKSRIMLLLAILLLGVGTQAAPQHYGSSHHQTKCSYQPKEECTTHYENVERKVTNVECHTEYKQECHTEYEQKCHTEYTTECHKVPTTRQVKKPEQKCSTDHYGKKTCTSSYKYVTVTDYEEKCEKVAKQVCENKPHEVCDNVVSYKTEKVPKK